MNTFCYILGSGLMDKPYAVENAISICVMTLLALLLLYGLNKLDIEKGKLPFWCYALCGCFAFIAFISTRVFIDNAFNDNKKKEEPFEKVKYEDHEYLIYKDCEVFHNPNCPCRKMINLK